MAPVLRSFMKRGNSRRDLAEPQKANNAQVGQARGAPAAAAAPRRVLAPVAAPQAAAPVPRQVAGVAAPIARNFTPPPAYTLYAAPPPDYVPAPRVNMAQPIAAERAPAVRQPAPPAARAPAQGARYALVQPANRHVVRPAAPQELAGMTLCIAIVLLSYALLAIYLGHYVLAALATAFGLFTLNSWIFA